MWNVKWMNNYALRITQCLAFAFALFLAGCGDFFTPVDSTPAPTEYSYNYWLLQRTYLYEDELPLLDENGDSVTELYATLQDPFTRYVPPSKSEATITHINTSVVPGDVGMEYALYPQQEHPLVINRVYDQGPAGRAGIPRYGTILNVNGVEIVGENAFDTYDSVLTYSKEVAIRVATAGDTTLFEISKEDVYAPTVFIDTLVDETIVITVTGFKLTTVDKENGTLGELKDYLDSTRNIARPRLLDLRNNPGGHVNHCTAMADLFIEKGTITTESWRALDADGNSEHRKKNIVASPGDAGEGKNFVVLVNKGSASCAEIFTAAIAEGANIPVAGTNTYGKGIGQSTWNTKAGGLAIITNLEFLTPRGNSYNKKGIAPDYPCESASLACGLEAIRHYYGQDALAKKNSFNVEEKTRRRYRFDGGAFADGKKL